MTDTRVSEQELAELERIAKTATPGPWEANVVGNEIVQPFFTRKGAGKPRRHVSKDTRIVALGDNGACGDPECCGAQSYHIEMSPLDAAHIAAFNPETALRLVRAIAALREQVETLTKERYAHAKEAGEALADRDAAQMRAEQAEAERDAALKARDAAREALRNSLREMQRLANLPLSRGTIAEEHADYNHGHGWRSGMGRACQILSAALPADPPTGGE